MLGKDTPKLHSDNNRTVSGIYEVQSGQCLNRLLEWRYWAIARQEMPWLASARTLIFERVLKWATCGLNQMIPLFLMARARRLKHRQGHT